MIKYILSLRVILLAFFICFLNNISFAKDIYVSAKGNDHNQGTKEKPFATLTKAQTVVRSIKGTVIVYIRGGTYYLTAPIIFTEKDSKKTSVIYKAYQNEKVIISGAVPLKLKWENYRDGIKKAKVNQDISFDQLFTDGSQQRMARYPNYNPAIRFFGGYAADAISPEKIKRWKHPEGGFIHALHKHEWGGYQYQILGKIIKGD
ncbi:right-handed parallel beta-helix repeat-containing protein [Pedobacter sp. NJ-S-72]